MKVASIRLPVTELEGTMLSSRVQSDPDKPNVPIFNEDLTLNHNLELFLSEYTQKHLIEASNHLSHEEKRELKVYREEDENEFRCTLSVDIRGRSEDWIFFEVPWKVRLPLNPLDSLTLLKELEIDFTPEEGLGVSIELTRISYFAIQKGGSEEGSGRYPIKGINHPNANQTGGLPCTGGNRWAWNTNGDDMNIFLIKELFSNEIGWHDRFSNANHWGHSPIRTVEITKKGYGTHRETLKKLEKGDPNFKRCTILGHCNLQMQKYSHNQDREYMCTRTCATCIMDCPHSPMNKAKRAAIAKNKVAYCPSISSVFYQDGSGEMGSPWLEASAPHPAFSPDTDPFWDYSPYPEARGFSKQYMFNVENANMTLTNIKPEIRKFLRTFQYQIEPGNN